MRSYRKKLAAMALGCTLISGCYSLDVAAVQAANGTAYTREQVLASPALMELVMAGVFINFWGGQTSDDPWIVFGIYGEEMTSAVSAAGGAEVWQHVQEPRPMFDNSLNTTSSMARDPWSNFYEANAASTEMPRLIRERNLKIIDAATQVDNTLRDLTFAKWLQGMSHINLGLIFDSAAIITTFTDLSKVPVLPLSPYPEVLDSGIKWLEEVIDVATNNTFLLPLNDDLWVYNTAFTNTQMVAVSHSYIARALAYKARTPEERAAADWEKIKFHAERGVGAPFGPQGFPNPLITLNYRKATTSAPDNSSAVCNGFCEQAGNFRVDQRLVGPADTSGAYQTWSTAVSAPDHSQVPTFIVRTPDQRIQPEGSTVVLNKPVFFKFTATNPPATSFDTINRGKYYISNYWNSTRALDNKTQFPRDGGGRNRGQNGNPRELGQIQDAMVLPREMRLLRAEAEYRLNNKTEAANLINESRLDNGELPAVTVNGVPVSPSCVPRRTDNQCGDLWDALMYEKRIETYGTGIAFFDARGWGCLLEGTPLHLPPPGRQLDLQDKLIYTFGGAGNPGSAPKPTNCPLLFKP